MRETIKLTREVLAEIANSWNNSVIKHNGIGYKIERNEVPDDDHSKHTIIFKRETDDKYFKFKCLIPGPYTDNNEYSFTKEFPSSATEVFPRVVFE
jgi:hypothetical protein